MNRWNFVGRIAAGCHRQLRSGKYPQQASLHLLLPAGRNVPKNAVSFYPRGAEEGLRNVLIIHGKGRGEVACQYRPKLCGPLVDRV